MQQQQNHKQCLHHEAHDARALGSVHKAAPTRDMALALLAQAAWRRVHIDKQHGTSPILVRRGFPLHLLLEAFLGGIW